MNVVQPNLRAVDLPDPVPRTTDRRLRSVGLFAGIGGVELGLSHADHPVQLLCEVDEGARAVLRARFPDVDLTGDVTKLTSLPSGTQLLAGGFPCQDLSQAGKTAGIGGARSGLVGEILRLVERQRVPFVLLENVPFMLQLERGRAMQLLVRSFEELGYRWAYRTVNSQYFGVPQRRRRVFFLATTEDDPTQILFADDSEQVPSAASHPDVACGFYWTEGIRGLGWAVDAVPTLKGGSGLGIPSPPAILMPDGRLVTPDIRDAERMQGFEAGWTAPAEEVGRASHRWKLVGNAVTVPVARWLGRRLALPGFYDGSWDGRVELGKSWPSAAYGEEGKWKKASCSEAPIESESPRLTEFLEHPTRPLSLRATEGFLRRTAKSSLRFPSGFLDAVRAHRDRMVD